MIWLSIVFSSITSLALSWDVFCLKYWWFCISFINSWWLFVYRAICKRNFAYHTKLWLNFSIKINDLVATEGNIIRSWLLSLFLTLKQGIKDSSGLPLATMQSSMFSRRNWSDVADWTVMNSLFAFFLRALALGMDGMSGAQLVSRLTCWSLKPNNRGCVQTEWCFWSSRSTLA